MAKWMWKGYFQAEIPDDWTVNESSDLIEMLPPRPVGALQISFFKVPDGEPEKRCKEAISNFVEKQGGQACGEFLVERRDSVLSVSSTFGSRISGKDLFWLISAIGLPGMIALVTYCYGGQRDDEVRRAVEIIRSISPA